MQLDDHDWPALAARFRRLYSPAVCDVLDGFELRHQFVHHAIQPLDHRMVLAGPAFTIVGMSNSTREKARRMGPRVIDSFVPHVVACYDTMGNQDTGVWGELWSAGAAKRGCVGAVVDGGIRDTAYIRRAGFPIFARHRVPADAIGRFNIIDFNCPVSIGGVRVNPGDYVFGDEDGIVIVPRGLTIEVLERAEAICAKENDIRGAVEEGGSLAELYERFERF
jgi:4-hydroxy-4-methyl-2-oxoglutarate aldolase